MEILCADHAGERCRQAWYNPFDLTKVWPHKIIADRGRRARAHRNPENYSPSRAGRALRPAISCPASAIRRTRCCRRGSSPMRTRTAIASASMPIRFPSTSPRSHAHYNVVGAMAARWQSESRFLLRAELVQRPGAGRALPRAAAENLRRCRPHSHRDGNDDYRQPGDLFRLMTAGQKEQLFQNYKAAMEGVPVQIVSGRSSTATGPIPNTALASPRR